MCNIKGVCRSETKKVCEMVCVFLRGGGGSVIAKKGEGPRDWRGVMS